MDRPALEMADIIRALCDTTGAAPGVPLNVDQRYVMRCLAACRTARLGGHVDVCVDCNRAEISYNSCRNRHCPKCQASKRAQWLEARSAEVLPTHYFHVVFTLPDEVADLALANKRVVYEMLFRAASQTLIAVAADPKHLGAKIGTLMVLHTWGQTLRHHPHVHCVIPGGGLAPDGGGWIACSRKFFLPVRVLSQVFRGKFLELLRHAKTEGRLRLGGKLAPLVDATAFAAFIRARYQQDWVVHAKKPFGGPEVVLKYLARYTHRVAIANQRLVAFTGREVTFRYKDYAHKSRRRCMTLAAEEFLRRFSLHALPKGFQRIRQYGLLGNRCRRRTLARCRQLLAHRKADAETASSFAQATAPTTITPSSPADPNERCCPFCGGPRLLRRSFVRQPGWTWGADTCRPEDSS